MRRTFIVIQFFLAFSAFAQKRATEIGVQSDNDLYISSVYDKYYTNGLELYYRYLNTTNSSVVNKKITEFKIGQYVYNPRTRLADNPLVNDRPFAGYLFAEVGRNIFYQNESVFKSNLQLGFLGPNALGKETQRAFHDIFGYKKVYGWQNQIQNAIAIQTNFFFSKKIFSVKSKTFDSHFQSEANLGTIWTSISTGIMSRVSLKQLLPIYNSNMHGASLNSDATVYKTEQEFFFYFTPLVSYQFYDATIEGSLFNDESPITREIIPFRLQAEAGFKYRKNNWNLSYSFFYRGKEINYITNQHYFYGSIVIGYLLK